MNDEYTENNDLVKTTIETIYNDTNEVKTNNLAQSNFLDKISKDLYIINTNIESLNVHKRTAQRKIVAIDKEIEDLNKQIEGLNVSDASDLRLIEDTKQELVKKNDVLSEVLDRKISEIAKIKDINVQLTKFKEQIKEISNKKIDSNLTNEIINNVESIHKKVNDNISNFNK